MSLPTTYATSYEIHADSEIYPYHLVLYRDGIVILQPDEYLEEKLIFRFKCTGSMMNAHFEPLIPLYAPSPLSNVLTVCTSFVSGSTAKPHAKSKCQQLLSDNSSIVINEKSRKRKCRPSVNDRIKTQKHREAVKKYTDKNPEVNRKAVKRYNNANPDVNRASVSSSTIDYCNDKVVFTEQLTECKWCHAKKWKEESPGICCSNGKVVLPPTETLPDPIHSLFLNNHLESQHFLTNIRKYNGCF
ncbi:hypothetical protein QTP88_029474 [Uroleucon formosanum]